MFQEKDPNIIYPLMLLYTNVALSYATAKTICGFKHVPSPIQREKARVGKAIEQCVQQRYKSTMPLQVSLVEKFVQRAIKQLHHCREKLGGI